MKKNTQFLCSTLYFTNQSITNLTCIIFTFLTRTKLRFVEHKVGWKIYISVKPNTRPASDKLKQIHYPHWQNLSEGKILVGKKESWRPAIESNTSVLLFIFSFLFLIHSLIYHFFLLFFLSFPFHLWLPHFSFIHFTFSLTFFLHLLLAHVSSLYFTFSFTFFFFPSSPSSTRFLLYHLFKTFE